MFNGYGVKKPEDICILDKKYAKSAEYKLQLFDVFKEVYGIPAAMTFIISGKTIKKISNSIGHSGIDIELYDFEYVDWQAIIDNKRNKTYRINRYM